MSYKILPLMLLFSAFAQAVIIVNCSNIDPAQPTNVISPNSQLACYIEGCTSNGTVFIWNDRGPAGSLSYAFVPEKPYLNIKGWDNALKPGYDYWLNATCTEGSDTWAFSVGIGDRFCVRDPWNVVSLCTPTLNDFGLILAWLYQNVNLILVTAIFIPIGLMALKK